MVTRSPARCLRSEPTRTDPLDISPRQLAVPGIELPPAAKAPAVQAVPRQWSRARPGRDGRAPGIDGRRLRDVLRGSRDLAERLVGDPRRQHVPSLSRRPLETGGSTPV